MKGHIKREWYDKCLDYHKDNYPNWWRSMVKEWSDESYTSHLWMGGSSSYFVRLYDLFFAVDPVWLIPGAFDTLLPELKEDLNKLDYIFFTHEHGDHFSPEQVSALKELDVTWIVPVFFEKWFLSTGVPREKCIFLGADETLEIKGARVTTHLGHHHYLDGTKGPEELMYVIEKKDKRLFFPGDVRDFTTSFIPDGHFDAAFVHVYVDRHNGYNYPFPDYYPLIAEYVASLDTDKIFLGHLYGFQCGDPNLIWNFMHAGMIKDVLFCLCPETELCCPKIGNRYEL